MTLGEYKGRILTRKEYDELPEEVCDYVFQKTRREGTKMTYSYVDARLRRFSNWTRYVNGAKSKEQRENVNMEVYQYRQKLFYRTCEDVNTDDELLIDYGSDYWTSDEEDSDEGESSSEEETTEENSEEQSSVEESN